VKVVVVAIPKQEEECVEESGLQNANRRPEDKKDRVAVVCIVG
jgi:hypothetical protein